MYGIREEVSMDNYVITFSRSFGSDGEKIAKAVSDKLGISYYNNSIIALGAQMDNDDTHDNEMLSRLKMLTEPEFSNPIDKKFMPDLDAYNKQKCIIESIAKTDRSVIVGKCADYVLKDYDNVFSVYISAPHQKCLKNTLCQMDITIDEAENYILKTDKYRSDYYRFYTGGNNWNNPVNYDLALNSGKIDDDTCVDIIVNAVREKFGI